MRRPSSSKLIASLMLAALPAAALAEKIVESNVDSRLTLAFQVPESELANWLPTSWRANPVPAGPSKGANLLLIFYQRMLAQGPDGKPSATGGTDRGLALAVPGKHAQTGEEGLFVTRIYTPYVKGLPGPYKNSVQADVRREFTLKGDNLSPGTASDEWTITAGGGAVTVRIIYERPVPGRSKVEAKPRSSIDPAFYRIYRVDQGVEVVKSAPTGVDRLDKYEFRSTIPELAKVLDQNARLISVTALPWYVRQVSLPSPD